MLTKLHNALKEEYKNKEEVQHLLSEYNVIHDNITRNISLKQEEYILDLENKFCSIEGKTKFYLDRECTSLCRKIRFNASDYIQKMYGLTLSYGTAYVVQGCANSQNTVYIPEERFGGDLKMLAKDVEKMIRCVTTNEFELISEYSQTHESDTHTTRNLRSLRCVGDGMISYDVDNNTWLLTDSYPDAIIEEDEDILKIFAAYNADIGNL